MENNVSQQQPSIELELEPVKCPIRSGRRFGIQANYYIFFPEALGQELRRKRSKCKTQNIELAWVSKMLPFAEAPWKKKEENTSSSDRFLLKPTGENTSSS